MYVLVVEWDIFHIDVKVDDFLLIIFTPKIYATLILFFLRNLLHVITQGFFFHALYSNYNHRDSARNVFPENSKQKFCPPRKKRGPKSSAYFGPYIYEQLTSIAEESSIEPQLSELSLSRSLKNSHS